MFSLLIPKTDFVFKQIFASEDNKSILIAFLNEILHDHKDKIISVETRNKDIEPLTDSTLCIKATTQNNQTINIEIKIDNNSNSSNLIQQSMYYWSKAYNSQIKPHSSFSKLNTVICINILDFNCIPDTKDFHIIYRLGNMNGTDELSNLLEIQFLEIPKLIELNPNDNNSNLEIWTEFLRNPESEVVKKAELSNIELKKAKQEFYKIINHTKS